LNGCWPGEQTAARNRVRLQMAPRANRNKVSTLPIFFDVGG
jgi:hypothetical protein